MKKAFLFLMIISLLSSVTACGENADIQPEISSYAKENTEAPSEEAFSYLTGLPVADYNGYKFRILSLGNKTIGRVRAEKMRVESSE